MSNSYVDDGKCHNSNDGTFNHECGKPAVWVGERAYGFRAGFCDHCKNNGDERRGIITWTPHYNQQLVRKP